MEERFGLAFVIAGAVGPSALLLTSANFTEAAQERNIEAGVVIDDEEFAKQMLRQLDYLIEDGTLVNLRLPKASGG
jgi:phosphatidylserine/phosphatidylglycerophosphate/cardiolipin synthase-like enzyme